MVSLYRPTVVLEPRRWKQCWSGKDGTTYDARDVGFGGIACRRQGVTFLLKQL
jgi:hypothetical protein